MDGERKINFSEGMPLNSACAANIFLNTGKSKVNPDGPVIHLKTEKPADVGVHINTTFSIASSKKIKVLFLLNFMLSVICMVISCSIAFYYWNEMISMRRQLDAIKDQFLIQTHKEDRIESHALVADKRPVDYEFRKPRMDTVSRDDISPKTYYVEGLKEDMLLVDSSKKNPQTDKAPVVDLSIFQKEPVTAHFIGASRETVIKGENLIVGPWTRDKEVSSKNSETKIELSSDYTYFNIKESGLYLVYAQLVYLTRAPNCFYVWASQPRPQKPRLLSACATGDVSSSPLFEKSQISCSVQTVTRLYKGDTVNISQREENRTLWLRPGYSYFGFVKLSS